MNLATATNVVFHYFLYFSSPFANCAKGLEIRLSLSPATLFSDVSLPNHTKMFELVHMVTSMEDFASQMHLNLIKEMSRVAQTAFPSTVYFPRNTLRYSTRDCIHKNENCIASYAVLLFMNRSRPLCTLQIAVDF
jgi:hypothetical protein